RLGPVADAIVDVEELSAMAQQPEVVQRDEAWDAAVGERAHNRRGEAREMMDVRDVGLEVVDEMAGDRSDGVVAIRVLERPRLAERVVDADNLKAVVPLGLHVVLRAARILA